MKKLVSLILVFVLTLSVLVCAQASTISDNQTTRNAETSSAEAEKPRPNLTSLRFTTPQALPTSIPL